MPVDVSNHATVPERLASAAFHLEEARRHNIEAAKALHVDLIPTEIHMRALFNADACRESLVEIADFAEGLSR